MMARQALAEFFEAAPPHMSEALEDRTWVVVKLLQERAKAILKSQETDRMDRSEPSGGPRNGLGSVSVAAIVLSMSHDVEDVLELRDIERTETRHLEARLRG